MNHPFENFSQWLNENKMTPDEKRALRTRLVSYAVNHPVKSGLMTPYAFRYAAIALASLVLVLGGSVGMSSAAMQSLPNQKLYALKIWIEEFRASNQKSPNDVIAFETKRIETRFNEAAALAVAQKLDDASAAVIQSGLEHSRSRVKDAAESVQASHPELALSATNDLETSFSSNAKVLAAIEKNTGQNIGTVVLAAQVATKNLALEKTKFEAIVAMKPNDITKSAAEAKLAILEPLVTTTAASMNVAADAMPAESDPATATVAVMITPTAKMLAVEVPAEQETPESNASTLVTRAKTKMNDGKYSEALVLLEKAEQLLDEAKLTESLENTYQVETVETTIDQPVTPEEPKASSDQVIHDPAAPSTAAKTIKDFPAKN